MAIKEKMWAVLLDCITYAREIYCQLSVYTNLYDDLLYYLAHNVHLNNFSSKM